MFYSPNLWLEHMFWLSDTWELRKIRIEIPMYIYDMIASYLCQSLQPNLLDSSIILKFKRQGIYYAFGKTCRAILMIFFWLDERQIPLSFWWLMPKNVENSRGKTSLTFNPLPDTYFFKFVIRDIFCCPTLLTNCKKKNTVEVA